MVNHDDTKKRSFVLAFSMSILGLSGFYPIHPRTYMLAWRNRALEEAQQAAAEAKETVAAAQQ